MKYKFRNCLEAYGKIDILELERKLTRKLKELALSQYTQMQLQDQTRRVIGSSNYINIKAIRFDVRLATLH
jgi:hypothetical protein